MSAKKFYKKIDISIWFFVMLLPVLVGFVNAIGYACNGWHFDSSSSSSYFSYILNGFGEGLVSFAGFIPTFLINTFSNLFTSIGLYGSVTELGTIAVVCSWFVWVVYLHLLVDVFAFIPRFFHKFLRRVDKYDE